MDTQTILGALARRYPTHTREWATLVEFCRIDHLAVNTWPSRRFTVHGHEIKASRNDWLRELREPEKSAAGRAMVDHWWLVAPPGVLKDDELPDDWGFMEVVGHGHLAYPRVVVDAPRLRAPLPKKGTHEWHARHGFAKMARRACDAETDRAIILADGVPASTVATAAAQTGRRPPATKKRRRRKKRERKPA